MGMQEILRRYDLGSDGIVYRLPKQYQETGTIVDNRGKSTKLESPNKGRPKKHLKKALEEMSKEEIIEK